MNEARLIATNENIRNQMSCGHRGSTYAYARSQNRNITTKIPNPSQNRQGSGRMMSEYRCTDAHSIIKMESIASFIQSIDDYGKLCDAFRVNSEHRITFLRAINSVENRFLVQSAVQKVSRTLRLEQVVTNLSKKTLVQSSLLSQYASPLTLVTLQVGAFYYLDILLFPRDRHPSLKAASHKIGGTIEEILQLQENEISSRLQSYYGRVLEKGKDW
jgi:hypothetical protein